MEDYLQAGKAAIKRSLSQLAEEEYVKGRHCQRLEELWWWARDVGYYDDSPGARELLEYFELIDAVRHPEWFLRGGRYVGVAPLEVIRESFFLPAGLHSHALVLPLSLDSGPLAGLMVLTIRHGVPVVFSHNGKVGSGAQGAWFTRALAQAENPDFPGGEVFITNEPVLGVWAQLRCLFRHGRPLPLVVLPPKLQSLTDWWPFRRPSRAIFWTRQPSYQLFRLAKHLDARIVMTEGTWSDVMCNIRRLTLLGFMQQLIPLARPWHEFT